jgi:hypothetical protein
MTHIHSTSIHSHFQLRALGGRSSMLHMKQPTFLCPMAQISLAACLRTHWLDFCWLPFVRMRATIVFSLQSAEWPPAVAHLFGTQSLVTSRWQDCLFVGVLLAFSSLHLLASSLYSIPIYGMH